MAKIDSAGDDSRTFDTTPEPAFLRGMQNRRWTFALALAELVDNSLGAGRGDASRVEIHHDAKARVLSILDNGRGMTAVGELFKLSATIGRSPGDIGIYGSGGTWALLWLNQRADVWTLRDGRISHGHLHWPTVFKGQTFPSVSNSWRRATPANTPAELLALGHGTLVRCKLLRERRLTVGNVKKELAETYAPALRLDKRLVWVSNGREEHLSAPLPSFDGDRIVDIDMMIPAPDGKLLGLHGQIGVVTGLPLAKSRVHVGFGSRRIFQTRAFFESANDDGPRYQVAGITGWLDLHDGWQPYLTTGKDAINDGPLLLQLRDAIFEEIKGLLEDLRAQKETLMLDDLADDFRKLFDRGTTVSLGGVEIPESKPDREDTRDRQGVTDRTAGPLVSLPAGDHERERPAIAQLQIAKYGDSEMEALLVRVEEGPDASFDVFVNIDHPTVCRALEDAPPNRDALGLLIFQEVSQLLSERPHLLKATFPSAVVRTIDGASPDSRRGLILRAFMDRLAA